MINTALAHASELREDVPTDDLADLGYEPTTQLGRSALAARREYLASGGKPLSREEINREVAERRGGTHLLDDE